MPITMADVSLDEEADAAYATLSAGQVARTEELAPGIIMDFDATGDPVGLEVLGLKARLGLGDVPSYLQGLTDGLLAARPIAAE